MFGRKSIFCLRLLIPGLILVTSLSCNVAYITPPPALPADYYSAEEVVPAVLVNTYYSNYMDRSIAEISYNDKVFILKNIELSEKQVERLKNEPVVWVDLIKCNVINTEECSRFTTGDAVDVIGINQGYSPKESQGLVFNECYIIPAGCVRIPSDDSGPLVIAGY
jgi:hypothetical protein